MKIMNFFFLLINHSRGRDFIRNLITFHLVNTSRNNPLNFQTGSTPTSCYIPTPNLIYSPTTYIQSLPPLSPTTKHHSPIQIYTKIKYLHILTSSIYSSTNRKAIKRILVSSTTQLVKWSISTNQRL